MRLKVLIYAICMLLFFSVAYAVGDDHIFLLNGKIRCCEIIVEGDYRITISTDGKKTFIGKDQIWKIVRGDGTTEVINAVEKEKPPEVEPGLISAFLMTGTAYFTVAIILAISVNLGVYPCSIPWFSAFVKSPPEIDTA